MQTAYLILLTVIAYLLGSIPSSVWIGKIFYGMDIREHGSHNAGAANTFRILGVRAGIPVLLFDAFKGWAAVKLIILTEFDPITTQYVNLCLIFGIAAVLGHIFPIYANFRGGKGVATLLGIGLAIHPLATLTTLGVFIAVLISTRYMSLSSMTAGVAFPFLVILVYKTNAVSLIIFSICISILLLITHQKNIKRLIRREESKANLFGWVKRRRRR